MVQVLADGVFQHSHVGETVVFRDADVVGERAQRAGGDAATAQAADGGHARVVPAGHEPVVHELHQLALAHHGVAKAEAGEFVLVRQRTRQVEVFQNPIVKRAVDLELERADAVRDALEVIAQAMGEVIHRVDAPFAAGVMVFRVANAVEDGIAQPNIRRRHVNFGAQCARAVGKLAVLHPREKVEIFSNGTIAERAVFAGTVGDAAVFVHVLGRKIADVGFGLFEESDGVLIELVEVVTRIERFQSGTGILPVSDFFA